MKTLRANRAANAAICVVSALALGATIVALSGCASPPKQMYVDWIAVTNPEAVCSGQADCVRKSAYRGRDLCTIVTGDRDVSYSRLGAQVRDCLK